MEHSSTTAKRGAGKNLSKYSHGHERHTRNAKPNSKQQPGRDRTAIEPRTNLHRTNCQVPFSVCQAVSALPALRSGRETNNPVLDCCDPIRVTPFVFPPIPIPWAIPCY